MAENNFKEVNKAIDARDFVQHILGEPVEIRGEEYYWYSLNKPDEKTPSLCANKEFISDFSMNEEMGKGLDVCNFVVYYNNNHNHIVADKDITQYEALVWIVKEFNLDIDISYNNTNSPLLLKSSNIQIIKTYRLEPTDASLPYEISTKFDTQAFAKKPKSQDVGQIKNRINNIDSGIYRLEDIKNKLISGYTCIPSGIKSKNDWIDGKSSLQIFMVDIDNKAIVDGVEHKYTINDEEHVTVEKILKYCASIKLLPNFVYYTFSHTEEQHRFRLVYILSMATQSIEEVEGVYAFLKDTFKDYNIDNSATDIARIFYGGKSIAYENPDNKYFKIIENVETIEIAEPSIVEKSLEYTGYMVVDGKLKYTNKRNETTSISNFIPYATEKITYNNGKDTNIFYKVNCQLLDKTHISLSPMEVDTAAFSKLDFILGSSWDKYAIVSYPQTTNTNRLKYVMQLINRKVMQEKTVYTHTGLREIDGELCYLFHRRNNRKCTEC